MSTANLADLLEGQDVTPPWLVPDLLCKGTIVVLAGEAGAGKSVLSYTISIALAAGLPVLNRPTDTTRVLYFDEENSLPDMRQYLRWVWRGLGRPNRELIETNLRVEHFSLAGAGPRWPLVMAQIASEHRPGLIVVDTATPACHISDENDNAVASATIRSLRFVRASGYTDCTMLVLKHARLDTERGRYIVRGAKAWVGETDGTIVHTATQGRPRKDGLRNTQLRPEKVRAFGLREPLVVVPAWTGTEEERGLLLAPREGPENEPHDSEGGNFQWSVSARKQRRKN